MIPYGRQDIRQKDIDAVVDVLTSDFLTQGPAGPRFERSVTDHVGAKGGVAVNSATSALHIACAALGLEEGGLLWTTPNTFVASANCGRYLGANVDFVDIDPKTYNMCPEALAEKLADAERANQLPDIVIPVHMCGQSADMTRIGELAKQYGFKVVEDASHAIGGKWDGEWIGKAVNSDIVVFSFHPVKIVTTAEGGMCLSEDQALLDRMSRLRTHGITRDEDLMTHASDGPWYYQQIELGWNYRITDMQAALGVTQMDRLDEYVERRNALAQRYDEALKGLALDTPYRDPRAYSAFHLYIIQLHDPSIQRDAFTALRERDIGVNLHYIPVHLQPYYRNLGFKDGDFPNAEAYYKRAISIPLFPTMTDAQQDEVIAALRDIVG